MFKCRVMIIVTSLHLYREMMPSQLKHNVLCPGLCNVLCLNLCVLYITDEWFHIIFTVTRKIVQAQASESEFKRRGPFVCI